LHVLMQFALPKRNHAAAAKSFRGERDKVKLSRAVPQPVPTFRNSP
jgi:hypothetical protein